MNIYEKLLAITSEMQTVAKNLEVGIGKNQYKAVGEADVLRAVKELEKKYNVYSYPYSRKVIDSSIMQTKKEYQGQVTEGNQIFMRLETVYRFVNIEKPEEYIDITTYGDGVDTQDKAPGKAMTYGDKYALMKAYKIITGEDPDQNPSPDNVTNLNSMFYYSTGIEEITFSEKWNTSKVTDMAWMFATEGNTKMSIKTITGLEYFNTSSLNRTNGMFYNCTQIISLDLKNFDTSNVTDMTKMFGNCSSLKTVYVSKSKWVQVQDNNTVFPGCKAQVIKV